MNVPTLPPDVPQPLNPPFVLPENVQLIEDVVLANPANVPLALAQYPSHRQDGD